VSSWTTHSPPLPDSRKHTILSILPREVPLKQASNLNVYFGDLPTFDAALPGTRTQGPTHHLTATPASHITPEHAEQFTRQNLRRISKMTSKQAVREILPKEVVQGDSKAETLSI